MLERYKIERSTVRQSRNSLALSIYINKTENQRFLNTLLRLKPSLISKCEVLKRFLEEMCSNLMLALKTGPVFIFKNNTHNITEKTLRNIKLVLLLNPSV